MKTQKELYITNEFGEVLDIIEPTENFVKIADGDRILRRGSIEYLKETVDIQYHFIKVNPTAYSQIAIKYPILNHLIRYVGYMDGILSYKNGRFVKLKDISTICNISDSTAKRQIKGLIQEDVIHKVKDKKIHQTYLMMNPWVVYIGKRIYASLYEEFKMSKWCEECEEV